MSLETDLHGILVSICPRVFPDVARGTPDRPYVTWQHIGGQSLRYLSGVAADKRHSVIQINVWSLTRAEALVLIRSIEEAVCLAPEITARPQGEAMSLYEPDTELYGSLQRFDVWSAR